MNKPKGQQSIEFILISSLILLGSLMGFLYFGKKISSFFSSDSAISKTYSHKVNTVSGSTVFYENNQGYLPPSVPDKTTPTGNIQTVNGVAVTFKDDGSASFMVNGQQINLTSDTMHNLNTVFETVGPAGLDTEIVKAIQQLINKHQSEFPDQAVPVNMVFGTGTRKVESGTGDSAGIYDYNGSAALNIVSIYVGGDYITIQKDQATNDSSVPSTNNRQIVNTTKISDTQFKGKYGSNYVNCGTSSGKYPDNCYYSSTGYSQANAQYGLGWTFSFKDNTTQNL